MNSAMAAALRDNDAVIGCRDLVKHFTETGHVVEVLNGINLAVGKGETLAIVGASGSGKSTLLHLLGGLELPTCGEVEVAGEAIHRLSDAQRGLLRNRAVGFVYQFHHLLPEFSALENVMLPQMIRGLSRKQAGDRAAELLTYLGLKDRLTHRPAELSGGEQQRVAIARAVANAPRLLLADEPTGNLDANTANHVFTTLAQLVRASGLAAVIATHNLDLAAQMDRRVTIRDGLVVELG